MLAISARAAPAAAKWSAIASGRRFRIRTMWNLSNPTAQTGASHFLYIRPDIRRNPPSRRRNFPQKTTLFRENSEECSKSEMLTPKCSDNFLLHLQHKVVREKFGRDQSCSGLIRWLGSKIRKPELALDGNPPKISRGVTTVAARSYFFKSSK